MKCDDCSALRLRHSADFRRMQPSGKAHDLIPAPRPAVSKLRHTPGLVAQPQPTWPDWACDRDGSNGRCWTRTSDRRRVKLALERTQLSVQSRKLRVNPTKQELRRKYLRANVFSLVSHPRVRTNLTREILCSSRTCDMQVVQAIVRAATEN